MELKPNCDYTVYNIYDLEVLALSERAILPTKHSDEDCYLLYSPYDCTVSGGCTKMVSMDLSVSTTKPFKHQTGTSVLVFFAG